MKIKSLIVAAIALAAFGSVRADDVTVQFTSSYAYLMGDTNVTFTGLSDTVMTAGGMAGPFSVGTLDVGTSPDGIHSGAFTINVTFSAPPNTLPPGATFGAGFAGTFLPADNGSASIFVDPTPHLFNFSFTSGGFLTTGFFTFQLTDSMGLAPTFINIAEDTHPGLFGLITLANQTTTHVPDGGATVSLLGMALVGVAALRRKFALG